MFVQKQPMIDIKRPMCPKAADVFAKSGRCPLRTKATDVENIYFEIFWGAYIYFETSAAFDCIPWIPGGNHDLGDKKMNFGDEIEILVTSVNRQLVILNSKWID